MTTHANPDGINFIIRPLKEGERITTFDCGDDDLNDFILNSSGLYKDELLAVTYLVQDRDDGHLLAYFSLANDRISLTDFESKTEFNRFRKRRFVNEKRLKSYPAVKIGRLGVSTNARHLRLGTRILDFIKVLFTQNNRTGCRFLTVDAYIAALPFYLKNDFIELTANDKEDPHTRLLYYDLKMNKP
ncbi:MAG TPA: GNAT family N-acetyltransferase [Candidatus Bacteroides intestinavium]|uniref:GNAT family N-acetyltransferase n=1 Tax=Candidatus Bacteroides intestinavium TaxID=2838469 RepID=A0A9D2HSX2_9BACE|nr:GNAT family N-acetyltransferase [Candidatus Bacteroides intestinavium]